MISLLKRSLVFFVPFTVVFWLIHDPFESAISRSTQNGLAGFYSADGLIFGLIIAFVIQREWEIWTNLSNSVRTEIDAIREMWKWRAYAEKPLCEEAHDHLKRYLDFIVLNWHDREDKKRSREADAELDKLRDVTMKMAFSMSSLGEQLQTSFTNLIQARNQRLNFSNEHMPFILKRIVILADVLFIFLSLFIAVNNIYLDYAFTASISLLAFALIMVVNDLDNPFKPGAWHLTVKGYEALAQELGISR
jgi:hypothetical protein